MNVQFHYHPHFYSSQEAIRIPSIYKFREMTKWIKSGPGNAVFHVVESADYTKDVVVLEGFRLDRWVSKAQEWLITTPVNAGERIYIQSQMSHKELEYTMYKLIPEGGTPSQLIYIPSINQRLWKKQGRVFKRLK